MTRPRTLNAPPAQTPTTGLFLAFEGGDGSGKSTQARAVAERLRLEGVEVLLTREPGGTALAEQLRSLVLDPEHAPVDAVTEALLFAAARSSHVRQSILPALAAGMVVITDRYIDSSVAYQGGGRQLGADQVAALNGWATDGLTPNLTVLLDVDQQTALDRRRARLEAVAGAQVDRMESEPPAFHAAIRQAFLDRAAQTPQTTLVLDAAATPEDLTDQVLTRVRPLLAARGISGMTTTTSEAQR